MPDNAKTGQSWRRMTSDNFRPNSKAKSPQRLNAIYCGLPMMKQSVSVRIYSLSSFLTYPGLRDPQCDSLKEALKKYQEKQPFPLWGSHRVFPYCSHNSEFPGKGKPMSSMASIGRILTDEDKDMPWGKRFFKFSGLRPAELQPADASKKVVTPTGSGGFISRDGSVEE
jgi:hypothetical protein